MRKMLTAILSGAMVFSMSISALAGSWKQDNTGWWYDWGNGTWPASSWQWIDGNGDGTAECYYFDRFGYCMMNATTPDNYQVNASGAWVSGGTVQTRNVTPQNKASNNKTTDKSNNASNALMLYDTTPILNVGVTKEEAVISKRENKTFTKALRFYESKYIEFLADGKYSKFKATLVPLNGWGVDEYDRMVIQVLEGDNELYVSPDVTYSSAAMEIEADISGCDVIRIKSINAYGYQFAVALINPRFE